MEHIQSSCDDDWRIPDTVPVRTNISEKSAVIELSGATKDVRDRVTLTLFHVDWQLLPCAVPHELSQL